MAKPRQKCIDLPLKLCSYYLPSSFVNLDIKGGLGILRDAPAYTKLAEVSNDPKGKGIYAMLYVMQFLSTCFQLKSQSLQYALWFFIS